VAVTRPPGQRIEAVLDFGCDLIFAREVAGAMIHVLIGGEGYYLTVAGSVALVVSAGRDTDRMIGPSSPLSSAPAGYRFPREVIAVAVRWYLRYAGLLR